MSTGAHPSIAVVVPYRGGCEHRDAAWAYVRSRWESYGFPVHVGGCGGLWRKAVAVQDAINQTDAEILIVADADVWTDDIGVAVEAVQHEIVHWAVPHHRVARLTEQATRVVLDDGPLGGPTIERPYPGTVGGGIVVVRRWLWETAPLDPRFIGWGQEDEAWGISLANHGAAPHRNKHGLLWHLWHPPQPRRTRATGSDESVALFRRYIENPNRALEEARRALAGGMSNG